MEEDTSLRLRGSSAPGTGFEARCPINLPDAGRALPPLDALDAAVEKTPAALPAKLRGYALALLTGSALPPAPPVPDGTTAPLAWHRHQPRLATVDGTGRVLIHAESESGATDPPRCCATPCTRARARWPGDPRPVRRSRSPARTACASGRTSPAQHPRGDPPSRPAPRPPWENLQPRRTASAAPPSGD